MNIIATKAKNVTVLIIRLVIGALISAAAVIGIPIAAVVYELSFTDPYVAGILLAIMAGFALVGYFCFMRPYIIYRKTPDIQAETDGEYLYLHGKKEAKIPLAELKDAYINDETPNINTSDFLIHLLSERYGHVVIEDYKHGNYKLWFVSEAKAAATTIIRLVEGATRN